MITERSVAAPKTHDDAYIERWAQVFRSADWHRRFMAFQVSFEAFLIAPELIMARIEAEAQSIPAPRLGLLPVQRRVQVRVDISNAILDLARRADAAANLVAERDRAYSSGGRLVIKMTHKAWPRTWHRRAEKAA